MRSSSPRAKRAHPRACGEHSISRSDSRTNSGSSPRVRGAHFMTSALSVQSFYFHSLFGASLALVARFDTSDTPTGFRLIVRVEIVVGGAQYAAVRFC